MTNTGFTFAELADELQHGDVNLPTDLASAVQAWEVTGHGSTATWSQRA